MKPLTKTKGEHARGLRVCGAMTIIWRLGQASCNKVFANKQHDGRHIEVYCFTTPLLEISSKANACNFAPQLIETLGCRDSPGCGKPLPSTECSNGRKYCDVARAPTTWQGDDLQELDRRAVLEPHTESVERCRDETSGAEGAFLGSLFAIAFMRSSPMASQSGHARFLLPHTASALFARG